MTNVGAAQAAAAPTKSNAPVSENTRTERLAECATYSLDTRPVSLSAGGDVERFVNATVLAHGVWFWARRTGGSAPECDEAVGGALGSTRSARSPEGEDERC
jgi:hypothetical protein